VPCGELASRWEEIVRLEMGEIDPSLEDSVEIDLLLVVVFAVRGLRISERGLESVISSFLRFLGTESEPNLRSVKP
jgi:hypothetical protein